MDSKKYTDLYTFLNFTQTLFKKGFHKGIGRGNDNDCGSTFEHLIGLKANSSKAADLPFGELKVKKNIDKLVTLFSQFPLDRIGYNDFYTINKYYSSKKIRDILNWSCTTKNGRLVLDNKKLMVLGNNSMFFYEKGEIIKRLDKIKTLINVYARENKGSYLYYKIVIYKDLNINSFFDNISKGIISYELRIDSKKDGTMHDHGPCFRVHSQNIGLLYNEVIEIDLNNPIQEINLKSNIAVLDI
jgi:hypothetical protein